MDPRSPSGALIRPGSPSSPILIEQPAIEAGKAYLSPNTKRAYFRDWKDFFKTEDLSSVTLSKVVSVTPDQVADFRDELVARGLGPGTINRKLTSLRAFFDYMILRGAIVLNPAHSKLVRSPKKGTIHKMQALSIDEAKAFLGAIDRGTPDGRRDYALIMTDLHMGLRRSEALSIRTEHFTRKYDQIVVLFRSKGEKEREIIVNADLAEALEAYSKDLGTAPGWLFPGRDPEKHLSGDQFWRIVQKYLHLARITKKVGTHGLRATFISYNLQKGTPLDEIQRTVGHARGETTLGYSREFEALRSRAAKTMEGFNAGPNLPKKEQT